MKHKKVKLCAALLLGLGLTGLHAQVAVPATGGNASGSGGTASYTIGQVSYNYNTGPNATEAQGVQQPYEILVVEGVAEAAAISLQCVVYPNPTADYIKLCTGNYNTENMSYYLYDINGKLLDSKKTEGSETTITMQSLPPAVYFLKVIQNNIAIKTFKIIKN
jgi:hypothetical protein